LPKTALKVNRRTGETWVLSLRLPSSVLGKLDSGFGSERQIAAFESTAARLMKAYTMQMEVLRRLRHGGHQHVRVEHVHINDGGQALIGNVKSRIGDGSVDSEKEDSSP